jgi:hypothetical protein
VKKGDENMALSVLENKQKEPTNNDLFEVLGDAKAAWDCLKQSVVNMYLNVTEEWKYYGKASGWTLILKLKKRTILYLFPCKEYFIVQFVYGEKAVEKAILSSLPENIMESIREAKPYAEGRSFRVEVKDMDDLESINELIIIKIDN